MNKRIVLICFVIIVAGGIAYAGWFYWNNLRGSGPAFGKPPANIVDLLNQSNNQSGDGEPSNSNQPPAPGVNETPYPLSVPDGFSVTIYAKDLGAPRDIAFGPTGQLMVSAPARGQVIALRDADNDGFAETHDVMVSGLNRPHGITSRCTDDGCELFVAETDGVSVFTVDPATGKGSNKRSIASLPTGGRHTTRSLMFLPSPNDQRLLVSIGSSCDVCHEADDRRAAIISMNADGSEPRSFATGLRNAVFMALHPVSGAVWTTEMGRDHLGDDLPPDEINIVEENGFYGWPICYGKNVHDTQFDKKTYARNPCQEPFERPSHIDLPAHSAPLGLAFIPEEGWPEEWWHDLLVAFHGSWNRTEPTGYKIMRYNLDAQGNLLGTEDFIAGWLTDDGALGRPVDIVVQPGGTVYISDDKAGVVYRVARSGE